MSTDPRDPFSASRLADLVNPWAPTDAVADVLGEAGDLPWRPEEQTYTLRRRLGRIAGVDHRWILIGDGIAALYRALLAWRGDIEPLVTFPPTELPELAAVDTDRCIYPVRRGRDFTLRIPPEANLIPRGATSIVVSPNNPTGTLLKVQELVRLSRQSGLVVVDERFGGYSPRSAIPFAREVENLIVLQSMEWWAGLHRWPLAWAVAPPSLVSSLESHLDAPPSPEAVLAALATLDDWGWVGETLRRVTLERGRLYRQLRKLSMISPPYASHASFLLARFERGGTAFFVPRLAERGIYVHVPDDPVLENHVRISAVSAEATERLKRALIDIALDL